MLSYFLNYSCTVYLFSFYFYIKPCKSELMMIAKELSCEKFLSVPKKKRSEKTDKIVFSLIQYFTHRLTKAYLNLILYKN